MDANAPRGEIHVINFQVAEKLDLRCGCTDGNSS